MNRGTIMTVNNSMEVRFAELMSQLFQLDEAERLDFGVYRIIKRHNQEVQEFLGEVVSEGGNKVLKGGKLSEIIENVFAVEDDEQAAGDRYRLQEIEKRLGLSRGIPAEALKAKLSELKKIPATKDLVEEYRSRRRAWRPVVRRKPTVWRCLTGCTSFLTATIRQKIMPDRL
jgi:adenine-specific DNA-methyltransferase